jgi:alginate O-acetyltransferase complex protein AlgI
VPARRGVFHVPRQIGWLAFLAAFLAVTASRAAYYREGKFMVFSSAVFLFLFLPLFLIGAFVSSRFGPTARNLNITVFGIAFYIFGAGIYTLILLGSILFNWMYAPVVAKHKESRAVLVVGIAINLLPLLVFKYLGFLFAVTSRYFFTPFLALDLPVINLFLPVGISFYTFQAISYLIDTRRGEILPETSLLAFATYKLLFPQMVAGPIVRYAEVHDDLHKSRITLDQINGGIFFFGMGLAKKMLIADPIGVLVDRIYEQPAHAVTTLLAWVASIGYSLQIFFDFSGYSEMAIGLGLMIGFNFPDNFNQPYRAHSISDFWRRWHMTLSRWFRDYLYLPLGGNRHGPLRTLVNLWIVFLLCGLWHGAALTFVVWGAWHGLLLCLERLARNYLNIEPKGIVGMVLTLLLVMIGWVIFRSENFGQAGYMLAKLAFIDQSGATVLGWRYIFTPYNTTLFVTGLIIALLPLNTGNMRQRLQAPRAPVAALAGIALLFLSIGALAANGFNPFIYFQF